MPDFTSGTSGVTGAGAEPSGDGALWGNPYMLAAYWADRRRWPLPGQQTPADLLHELAVMATLADWLRRWLPIPIHDALAGGAGVEAVAAAAGVAPNQLRSLWEPWADRQVDLWRTSNPHRPIGLNPDDADRVHVVLRRYDDQPRQGGESGG